MQDRVYLAFDQSLSNTGVAISDGETIITSNFCTKRKDSTVERLKQLEDFLAMLVSLFRPSEVFLEEIYIPSNRLSSGIVLSKVETTMVNYLYRNSVSYTQISPNPKLKDSWTKVLGLSSTKEGCKEWLGDKYSKINTTHEVDAVGILWGSLVKNGIVKASDISKTTIKSIPLKKLYQFRLSQESLGK